MDSTWFAVDDEGKIGFFDTGEGGAIPVEGFPCGLEAGGDDPLEASAVLFELLQREAQGDPELAELLPPTLEKLEELLDGEDEKQLLLSLGVWVYVCDEPDAYPYVRIGTPRGAVPLLTLPTTMRQQFSPGHLPVKFGEHLELAPGEYHPVASWTGVWFDTQGRPHRAEGGSAEDFKEAVALAASAGTGQPTVVGNAPTEPFDRQELLEFFRSRRTVIEPPPQESSPPVPPRSWLMRLFGRKP